MDTIKELFNEIETLTLSKGVKCLDVSITFSQGMDKYYDFSKDKNVILFVSGIPMYNKWLSVYCGVYNEPFLYMLMYKGSVTFFSEKPSDDRWINSVLYHKPPICCVCLEEKTPEEELYKCTLCSEPTCEECLYSMFKNGSFDCPVCRSHNVATTVNGTITITPQPS